MNPETKTLEIDNRILSYHEIILKGGTQQINRTIAKENLQLFCSVMEKAELKYGLFFGTLLGALREHDFIVHDQDTDIYMLYEHRDNFLRLLFEFDELDLKLVRLSNDLASLMRKGEYIDVYFFRPKYKFGIKRLRVFNNEYEFEARCLENIERINFQGINTFIPINSLVIIRKLYGKNWKIPLKNFQAPPNTIYKRISNMTPGLQRIMFYKTLETFTKYIFRHLGL